MHLVALVEDQAYWRQVHPGAAPPPLGGWLGGQDAGDGWAGILLSCCLACVS
jgi:hypothetical protein